jgi:hypothetical protein
MTYGFGYDCTFTPILQMLVREDGTLDPKTLESLENRSSPVPVVTANLMNHLCHVGEAVNSSLKSWKVKRVLDTTLGPDIRDSPIYQSFINDKNNTRFNKQAKQQYEPIMHPFPYYGCCILVAFRNCELHSRPVTENLGDR